MGKKYMIEQYRESDEVIERLYKAKMAICEAIEELENHSEYEEREYRMNKRMNNRGRYDY